MDFLRGGGTLQRLSRCLLAGVGTGDGGCVWWETEVVYKLFRTFGEGNWRGTLGLFIGSGWAELFVPKILALSLKVTTLISVIYHKATYIFRKWGVE